MLDAPEIFLIWGEATSLLLHKSMHFFNIQISLLQQAFLKSVVVYLENNVIPLQAVGEAITESTCFD